MNSWSTGEAFSNRFWTLSMLQLAVLLSVLLLSVEVVLKPVRIFDRFFIISDSYLAAKAKVDEDALWAEFLFCTFCSGFCEHWLAEDGVDSVVSWNISFELCGVFNDSWSFWVQASVPLKSLLLLELQGGVLPNEINVTPLGGCAGGLSFPSMLCSGFLWTWVPVDEGVFRDAPLDMLLSLQGEMFFVFRLLFEFKLFGKGWDTASVGLTSYGLGVCTICYEGR